MSLYLMQALRDRAEETRKTPEYKAEMRILDLEEENQQLKSTIEKQAREIEVYKEALRLITQGCDDNDRFLERGEIRQMAYEALKKTNP